MLSLSELFWTCGLALSGAVGHVGDGSPPVPVVESAAVERVDGRLWGFGDDYKVEFGDRASFFPALGERAERHYPVRFTTLSIGRDEQSAVDRARPEAHGLDVHYPRGEGVTERYAVRGAGVELSYRFESRPLGRGDLVVRVRVETDLELAEPLADDGSFRLRRPDVGGVRVGAVTGVDAGGTTVAGRTRYEDGIVELSLPAAFVDQAEYPMVLDPLIETDIVVAAAFDEHAPDVAYDRSTDTFLIVWSRRYTQTDYAIYGSRYDSDGNFKGFTVLALESGEPSVANMALRDQFVVTWKRANAIRCCSLDAATGVASAAVDVENVASHTPGDPDVGGESTHDDDDVIIVWDRSENFGSGNEIRVAQVQVALDGTPIVFGVKTLDAASGDAEYFADPRISKSGGPSGRHLVVWRGADTRGVVIDRDTIHLDDIMFESVNSAHEVDGNGSEWMVAYNKTGGQQIVGRWTRYDDASGTVTAGAPIVIHEHPVNTSWAPAVCTFGGEYLVAFKVYVPLPVPGLYFPHQVWSRTVQPIIHALGPLVRLDSIPPNDEQYTNQSVALASRQSGGPGLDPSGAEAMVVWDERDNYILAPQEGQTRVLAARFALLGGIKDVGGGSSGGGSQQAILAADALHVELEDAPASSPTMLLAGAQVDKVFRSQSLLAVDPINAMIVFHGTSNVKGGAEAEIQLANMPAGSKLYLQWGHPVRRAGRIRSHETRDRRGGGLR